ncbi:MAG: hypothetical protein ACYDC2_02075 [Solirubrobacteraceae bacterium]
MEAILIVLGGLVAAALGAWLAERLRRARPQVIPTSVRRTIDVIPQGSVVAPNAELVTACSEHPFLEKPPFEGIGKVDEREYVAYLVRTHERVQEFVRLQLPAVATRAEQLQMRLAADDFDGVAHIWIDSQLLWTYAEGAYVRKEFTLPGLPQPDEEIPGASPRSGGSAEEPIERGVSSQGSHYVFLPGFVQGVVFPAQNRTGKSEERSQELGKRMADAFVNRDKSDLVRVFNFLAGIQRYAPQLEALNQQVANELARLTRLCVTALVANTGTAPVSLSDQTCKVELMLDGYNYSTEEDGGSKTLRRRGDLELELLLLDGNGFAIEPIAVVGGGVHPVTAVYRTPLSEESLPDGGTLYDLLGAVLEGAERNWRVTIKAVLQRDAATSVASRKASFSDTQWMATDTDSSRLTATQKPLDELRAAVDARDTELSALRAELANVRTQLNRTEDLATRLYESLRGANGAGGQPTESHDGGATPPTDTGEAVDQNVDRVGRPTPE